ncbi:MAG TPA: tetratricopeptide repeat protein [Longimicrobiales bacterium]|nr:tetratricopeptide repeat protein [Longimicrobiales bacterium]
MQIQGGDVGSKSPVWCAAVLGEFDEAGPDLVRRFAHATPGARMAVIARSRPPRGALPLVAACWCLASACGLEEPQDLLDPGPRKIVVQAANTGSLNAAATAGLILEITHWLQYDSTLIVRTPSRRSLPVTDDVVAGDIDEVLWVEARTEDGEVAVRWDLVGTDAVRPPSFAAHGAIRDALPRLPGSVAAAVASTWGRRQAMGKVTGPTPADDGSAYLDFLRILGAPPTADDPRDGLRTRIERLDSLGSRLPDYVPLSYALGSAYLDLAGLVGGTGPYYRLAEEELTRAFELDPEDPPVRAKLASFFAKLGRSEESVSLLVEGLATHPHFPEFHQTLGYVLRYAGLMEESMASYGRSQELDSSTANLVSAQDQITKSLIYLGDYDAALASHRRMLAFAEQGGRSVDEKQWFYEGVIHLYRGDADSAVHALRAGARLDPVSVWTTFGRAYEGMALGDTAAVARVLDELEQREVVDGERHYRLVHFAAFIGEVDRAVHHLRQSTGGGFFNASYLATDPWTEALRGRPDVDRLIGAARVRGESIAKLLEDRR